jgi:hypothetical protein
VNAVKRAYSVQVVNAAAKRFGWQMSCRTQKTISEWEKEDVRENRQHDH